MKKNFLIFFVLMLYLGVFFISCASTAIEKDYLTASKNYPTAANPYRPLRDMPNATVIDMVETGWRYERYYTVPGDGRLSQRVAWVNEAVYLRLLAIAKDKHKDVNIDIVDIYWSSYFRDDNRPYVRASGKVVTIGGKTTATGVEGALERAAVDVAENFTAKSRIAIVYITASDRSLTTFITGEIEHLLRKQGFVIIDRSELDRIRTEQQFGLSAEVDDATAARIGNFAGANIVITGRVDGEGNLRRLRLRALDTSSAQVVGTASERW